MTKKKAKKKTAKSVSKEVEAALEVVDKASNGLLPRSTIPGVRQTFLSTVSEDNLIRAAKILAAQVSK